uniref:G-protein coupled receptors family 1 profile domain-containing protein n=1 Tax=Leptobrachium leishanense TaxID=445787 RepID=A0A8C5R0Y6_9ANUR
MALTNQSTVTYFIFKGISDLPELQVLIFLLVLLIYLISIGGNMTILLLICLNRRLHTPMYFFLGNLSVMDISNITVTLHTLLIMTLKGDTTISFSACMAQMYVFSSLTIDALLMLTAMGYDRFVAICKPLNYVVIMNQKACVLLALACWVLGFIELSPYIALLSGYSCYKSNVIDHFYCDVMPILKISCSDTSVLQIIIIVEGLFCLSLPPLLLTFISYVFIIKSIMKIHSNVGRRKAFYTCSSHLTVVTLLYLTLFSQYLRPVSTDSMESNKLFALFNAAAIPLLNPLIYSLRNNDVKSALGRRLKCFKTESA